MHKAKIASLTPQTEEPSSTASGSRDVPREEYEEIAVEADLQEESDDENWGNWKPSQCLVDLGFSKKEAKELVRHYRDDVPSQTSRFSAWTSP